MGKIDCRRMIEHELFNHSRRVALTDVAKENLYVYISDDCDKIYSYILPYLFYP